MRPTRIIPILLSACLIASTSCSDAVSRTWAPRLAAPATRRTTLQGVVQRAPSSPNDLTPGLSNGWQGALASEIDGQPSAFGIIGR